MLRLEISSSSDPSYTGRQHFVDSAGQSEKIVTTGMPADRNPSISF